MPKPSLLISGCEKAPANPLLNYVPPDSESHVVAAGEDWWKLAALSSVQAARPGMTALELCNFNFKTSVPAEINWYLRNKAGCTQTTADKKNYKFAGGETVFLPIKVQAPSRPSPPPLPPNTPAPQSITIMIGGGIVFKDKIFKAIRLLQSRYPRAYRILTDFVGLIRPAQRSGMDVNNFPPAIDVAPLTFEASLEWLASMLAHESFHSMLYSGGLPFNQADAERKCNSYQLEVLRAIGGSPTEIQYMLNQDGTHGDEDGDGDYDWDDYKLRRH